MNCNGYSSFGGCGNIWWIIILLLLFCGCGNGLTCGSNNNCGSGCGNSCGNNCGC